MLGAQGEDVLSQAQFDRARWLFAERYKLNLASSPSLVRAILEARNNDFPLTSIDEQPRNIAEMQRDEIARVIVRCGHDSVLSMLGDEPTIRAALAAE
jgi:hypothetical protein